MSWTSTDLRVVGDDNRYWTVAQAAAILGPPRLSVSDVRQLLRLHGVEPVGKRRTSVTRTGRYARVYLATDIIKAHESLSK